VPPVGRARAGAGALLAALAVVPATTVAAAPATPVVPPSGTFASVIVRESPAASDDAERAIAAAGGTVGRRIGIIDAFEATVPTSALATLGNVAGVLSVSANQRVELAGHEDPAPVDDPGSMFWTSEVTGAADYWEAGITGNGVDVALIDSGVVAVDGLSIDGKVVHGPDLSFESQDPELAHLDTFGHGTHMAGIIAGRDSAAAATVAPGEQDHFLGMAPDSRLVSIKVANADGSTDVSQVLAAIDWVVQHRNSNGLNIRVLNLSFGTDGTQDYRLDPLTYAVEVAWRHGITVVVAAGNEGYGSEQLNNPAYDPTIIAVGGADSRGTYDEKDDVVGDFSSRGDKSRRPDVVAPGKSVVSLRAPGSLIDELNPNGRVGERLMRGTGTSQAAAVVSGAVALMLEERPELTPDQVKYLLTSTAQKLMHTDAESQGKGMIDLAAVREEKTPSVSKASQATDPATGLGSLDAARGSSRLVDDGVTLEGEIDIFGQSFTGSRWTTASATATAWNDGEWNGSRWSGSSWSGSRWSGVEWTGSLWSGSRWSGSRWSGSRWSGSRWSGSWSGDDWAGSRWSGSRWSGSDWS
jgi:serine protease AprX